MGEPTRKRLGSYVSGPTFRLRLIQGGAETILWEAPEPAQASAAPSSASAVEAQAAPPTRGLSQPPNVLAQPLVAPARPAAKPPTRPYVGPVTPPGPPQQKASSNNLRNVVPPPALPSGPVALDEMVAAVLADATARRLHCFPFHREGGWLWVATDAADREALAEEVARETGLSTVVAEAPFLVVETVLEALYGTWSSEPLRLQIEALQSDARPTVHIPDAWAGFDFSHTVRDHVGDILMLTGQVASEARVAPDEEEAQASTSHAARLVDRLLGLALEIEASDVHLEPDEDRVRVRIRLDGVLQPLVEFPLSVLPRVVGRLKVLAGLNLVEKRLPQEARFRYFQNAGRRVDVRVSTMPAVHGEGAVLRLLDTAHLRGRVDDLGLEGEDLLRVRRCLRGPRGLVLATGPTGSGKSTTLYTLATELNDATRKIVTIEDPVEYHLPGLQQIQVQSNIGLTFERIIRSTLRQDPDVILVGEIRDGETARAAVKAALTGHLVLSSLHTADAAGAVARLIDLGVEPSMCSAALRLVLGQRLMRTLCPNCRRPVHPEQVHDLLDMAGIDPTIAEMSMEAVGCLECRNVGYHGRRAVFEVLDVNSPRLRRLIQSGASAEVLQTAAVEEGMTPLAEAALALVRDGETTIEEALRVVWLD